jgi:capsular polysaccharide biosynthesis protein
MTNLLIGFVLGIVISTVGFSGIAKMLDNSVEKVKQVTVEQAK